MSVFLVYLPHITASMAFVCMMLVAWGWIQYAQFKSQRKRLIQKVRYSAHLNQDETTGSTNMGNERRNKMTALLGKLGKWVARNKVTDPLDTRSRFLKAGLRGEKSPAIFWGVKVVLAILFPLAFLLVNAVKAILILPSANMVILLSLPALIGFYLPDLWLYNRGLRRKQAVLNGFPDALDLLVVCVEAGMGLDAAINRVAREIQLENPVLSDELTLFNLEMRAGMQRRDALKNLSLRTDLLEVTRLTTLLIQTDRFGTSVGNALKVFSDTLRTQRYQRAEELAGKLPVKLIFPLILFIFPSLFVVILGPAAIQIFHTLLK